MDMESGSNVIRYLGIAETADKVRHADRILVVGCSGGGKSTLSQKIARRFGLVYISIDRDVLWLPGWIQRERSEQRRIIDKLILQNRWIMDGSNSSTFDLRVPRADIVIWLRLPRHICIWGVVSRWMRTRGRTRPEMAAGCPERLDLDFLHFVWTFEEKQVPKIADGLQKHGADKPVLVLKSRREMRELLDLVGADA